MSEEIAYIYTLEFPEGDIRYIGKTTNPKKRFYQHLHKSKREKTYLSSWIHSLKNKGVLPVFSVIDVVSLDESSFWERYYISLFKTFGFRLTNLTDGGEGCFSITRNFRERISIGVRRYYSSHESHLKGIVKTEEEKLKLKGCHKNFRHTEESKKKISEKHKGKVMSEESRRKLSTSKLGSTPWNKGVPHTDKTKEKLSKSLSLYYKTHENPFKGHQHTEEAKLKQSLAKLGKEASLETKRKISKSTKGKNNWSKGKSLSDETKEKLSKACKGKIPGISRTIYIIKRSDNSIIGSLKSVSEAMEVFNKERYQIRYLLARSNKGGDCIFKGQEIYLSYDKNIGNATT